MSEGSWRRWMCWIIEWTFFFLQCLPWPSASSTEVLSAISLCLAGRLVHSRCWLQAVICNGWPQDPVLSCGSSCIFSLQEHMWFCRLVLLYLTAWPLFGRSIMKIHSGVIVEAQWAEQGVEMSKGLLSSEAGGMYEQALLASSWAGWLLWRGAGDRFLLGCSIPEAFCMGA